MRLIEIATWWSRSKLAVVVTFVPAALLAAPASAVSSGSVSIEVVKTAGVEFYSTDSCERVSFNVSTLLVDTWSSNAPASRIRSAHFEYYVENRCTPGAFTQLSVYGDTPEGSGDEPTVDTQLRSASARFVLEAEQYTCNQQPSGLYDCGGSTTPVSIDVVWKGRGPITRDGGTSTLPQGDGTVLISTGHGSTREGQVTFRGTIGDRAVDLSDLGLLSESGAINVIAPAP